MWKENCYSLRKHEKYETERKSAGIYASSAKNNSYEGEARQLTINSKTLSVAIKPKDKGKFKSMEEAKVALQKAL